jgi:hypothetical protein
MITESPNSQATDERPQRRIPDYEITEPTSDISIEWQGVLTRHQFRKATKEEFILLSEAFVRSTEQLGGGRERFRYDEDEAYSSHYMIIIEKAWVKPGDDEPEVELLPEQIGELTFELRAEVVRQLYRSNATIERKTEGYDHLFDREGLWIVRQTIGDPLNPQFVIRHTMARPGKERRVRYRDNAQRIEMERKGKKSKRDIIIDIEEGMRLFRQYFKGIATGATVGGKPYNAAEMHGDKSHQDTVLAEFNQIWQADVADALVSSYQADGSD